MVHPNTLLNLKPIDRTGILNPNAGDKPRRFKVTEAVKDALERKPGDYFEPETNAEAVAEAALRFAKAGSAQHIKEVREASEGPLTVKVEVTDTAMIRYVSQVFAELIPGSTAEFERMLQDHPEGLQMAACNRLMQLMQSRAA